ncbi:SOS response-associated peptidase [Mesorhizobium sp. A623]
MQTGELPVCGRYTRYLTWGEIHRLYRLTTDWEKGRNTAARYNITPTQTVDFITPDGNGNHKLHEGRWGLVPWWSKEIGGYATFNAKSEEAASKPAFRDAFKSKRCLIPADGFYEWTKSEQDGGRDPWHIFMPDHQPFSFAGLWAHNEKLGIESCTILTAEPVALMASIHNRMPIILKPEVYDHWMDPETPVDNAKELMKEHLDGDLQMYRVDRQVNSNKWNGGAEGIAPI